jgi:alpha-D-ribose 1-methylphosphonate 5-triphosphate synthase subunit PhnL
MTQNLLKLRVQNLHKTFTLHGRGGIELPVFQDVSFDVASGECVALVGSSGSGKSTLLRSLYANYLPSSGKILINHHGNWVDIASVEARTKLEIRRETIGYVSQFLRVIPRISSIDLVAEVAIAGGSPSEKAMEAAEGLLRRLNLPEHLWNVPPATFSGGEQQRVNIAMGLVRPYSILLLDEPTASLDAVNREAAIELILEAKKQGAAIVVICHDEIARDRLADRLFDVSQFKAAA